jgi:tight adherence protein B
MDDTLMLYLIPVFTFVSVIAFIGASYYLWVMLHEAGSAKMQRRMRLLSAGGAHGEELLQQKHFSDIPFLNDILIGIPRVHAIDRVLVQAALNLTVVRFFIIQFITIVVVCLVLTMAASLALMVALPVGILAGISLP